MLRGGILSETDNSNSNTQPDMAGRVLYERFLVERDLTDRSIGSGFSALAVKDLKNFCRDVIFKTLAVQQQALVGGPTLQNVCEALARIRHPNIEEVLETGLLFDGRPYAVTSPVAGRSLVEIVRDEGRLELSKITAIIEQVSDALAAAHSVKVLHCDIRPSNIVVSDAEDGDVQAYLINFGAAWPVDVRGVTLENLPPGSESLSYAAPELHAKLGHRSTASDIFSLAAVAYRLVTGRVPFLGDDRVTLLRAIDAAEVVRPTGCRTDLLHEAEALILAGLQFEPAWRPQNVEDFGIRLVHSLRHPSRPAFVPAPLSIGIQPAPEPMAAAARHDAKAVDAAEMSPNFAGLLRTAGEPRTPVPLSDRAVAWALIVLLLAGAMSIPIGQTLLAEERTPPPAAPATLPRPSENGNKVQLRYWFEQSPGQTRKSGDADQNEVLVVSTSSPGDLLVIGEAEDPQAGTSYRLVTTGAVAANEPVRAADTLRAGERMWVVWTPPGQGDLDVSNAANSGGVVADEEARRLRHFLERNRNLRVAVSRDEATGQIILDGAGDRVVHRIEQPRN